jgi:hypothetical protein
MTITSMVVALGIFGIVALVLAKITGVGSLGASKLQRNADLESLRQTLITQLDCRNTLRVTGAISSPLNCASYTAANHGSTWSLRHSGPNSAASNFAAGNKVGGWTVNARCSGNELIIGASRPGTDPLTRKSYASAPEATDLFRGLSDFCREYFDPAYFSCSGTYSDYQGRQPNGMPLCCRHVYAAQTGSYGGAIAQCGAFEYLAAGSGNCWASTTTGFATISGVTSTPGYDEGCGGGVGDTIACINDATTHKSWYLPPRPGDAVNQAFMQECHPPTIPTGEAVASASAVCCPRG